MSPLPRGAPPSSESSDAVRPGAGVLGRSSDVRHGTAQDDALDWVSALSSPGLERDDALRRLHPLMVRAARHQVRRMRAMLPHAGARECEDLANGAADDALAALLGKLSTFEGRSRFTTWAYKFAILQAATEVRRQSWVGREIVLDDIDAWTAREPGPEQQVEASDLAAAVWRAMGEALTPYQRKIAVALLVDLVPIDVLADRLGTTRGALYKTLHMARGRLRAHLIASGHLAATPVSSALSSTVSSAATSPAEPLGNRGATPRQDGVGS